MSELTESRVIAFLARFETPEAVAEECRVRGIRGTCGAPESCAVVGLLLSEFPDGKYAEVSPGGNGGTVGTVWISASPRGGFHTDAPASVNRFALKFDEREYPDLIDPTDPENDI